MKRMLMIFCLCVAIVIPALPANASLKLADTGSATVESPAGTELLVTESAVVSEQPTTEPTSDVEVAKIKITRKSAVIKKRKKLQLKAEVYPENAANTELTWKSGDTKKATVNTNGVIKAKMTGKVTISVTTANGKKAACRIIIRKKSAYYKPYHFRTICDDAAEYAKTVGMTWNSKLTKKGGTWDAPGHLSSFDTETEVRALVLLLA